MQENNFKIDVYSDKFKTIKIIDFEKLKTVALELKKISETYKPKSKIFNFLDKSFSIFTKIFIGLIILFMIMDLFAGNSLSRGLSNALSTAIEAIIFYIIIYVPYKHIKTTILGEKRVKYFPTGTPIEIIYDYESKLSTQDIEKMIYMEKVLVLPDKLPSNINYKILQSFELQDISSSKSDLEKLKHELLSNAYNIKANILINYKVLKNTISTTKSSGFGRVESIRTDHRIETIITAVAVQAINENNNLNSNIEIGN
jgi:hypothetical protein